MSFSQDLRNSGSNNKFATNNNRTFSSLVNTRFNQCQRNQDNRQHQHLQSAKNYSNPFIGNASSDKVMQEIKQSEIDQSVKPTKDTPKKDTAKTDAPKKDIVKTSQDNESKNDDIDNLNEIKDNNHGWPNGWSLEKEFIKQSSNISIKPEHQKYLQVREIDNDYPQEKYRRRKGDDKKHIIYWAQRKLLLSEIEFLNFYLAQTKPGKDGCKLIIYAGAAPAIHIPILFDLYDNIIMHLWDPNEFCAAVQNLNKIQINSKIFTNEIAEMYGSLGRDILFISDIRSADLNINKETNQKSIQKDNNLQMQWTQTMASHCNLVGAMIKFRLPYPHLIDTKWHNQLYLDGIIKLSIWGAVTATETRLHIKPDSCGNIKQKIYNCKIYEEQLFWFNVNARQSIVNNSMFYCPHIGIIHSYDCWAECNILTQYFKLYKQIKITPEMVIGMVNKISSGLDKNRCLLTHYSDVTLKILSNHQTNPHGLIGHEGIVYNNVEQTKKIHDDIIMRMEECGMDTWIFPIINPMPRIMKIESEKINQYGLNVLPCYNRPLYNMFSINKSIYLIPLNGFGNVSFKIAPKYAYFYEHCFGDMFNCCCLTGFLMDNGNKNGEIRFEFSIIDILLVDSYEDDDYNKRKKQIKYIVNNYEKYKDYYKNTGLSYGIYKYMPVKLRMCPLKSGGQRNIQLFMNKIVKHGDVDGMTHDRKALAWNDVYFDRKHYTDTPVGYYFDEVELNSRIGAILWITNQHRNILLDGMSFSEL